MNILRFFHGTSVLFLFSLASCNGGEKRQMPNISEQLKHNDYGNRINNIFSYIKESKFQIPFNECNNIIILQTNLCNSCDREKLAVIFDSLAMASGPIYFILANEKSEIKKEVLRFKKTSGLFIDTLGLLQKNNLSFLKNIRINTCNEEIIKWSFL